jgi:PAS domain S-box-containing protein
MQASGDHDDLRRLAFDQAPVALSLLDLSGRQVDANDAYLVMFGLEREGLHEVTALGVTHPGDQDRTREYLAQLARGEVREVVTEKLYVRRDGSAFQGRLVSRPMFDADGAIVGILGVIRDLTEQEVFDRIERRLDAREELQRMAATGAHELNNILAALSLELDLDETMARAANLRSLVDRAARLGEELVALAGDDVAPTPALAEPVADPVDRPSILVVDDEPSLLDTLAQTLRRSGYEVQTQSDPLEALEFARATSVGLLVTDLVMPGMDGVTLAERMRVAQPDLPVLFITGHVGTEVSSRLPSDAAVLRKPFRALDLVSSVARLTPSRT